MLVQLGLMSLKEENNMSFQFIWCDVGTSLLLLVSPSTLLYFTPGIRRHLHGMMAFTTAAV